MSYYTSKFNIQDMLFLNLSNTNQKFIDYNLELRKFLYSYYLRDINTIKKKYNNEKVVEEEFHMKILQI